jgi:hypothetical protein
MISKADLSALVKGQHAINVSVNAFWIEAGYPFARYIGSTAATGFGQYGWAWKQRSKREAVRAIGALWRCVMSSYLMFHKGDHRGAADALAADLSGPPELFFDLHAYAFADMASVDKVQLLGALALSGRVYPRLLTSIMEDREVTWADILAYYRREEDLRSDFPLFQDLSRVSHPTLAFA